MDAEATQVLLNAFDGAFYTATPKWQILIRLTCAILLSFAIGFDREYRNHPAGLRTNLMTALAAAVFALITLEMAGSADSISDQIRLDPIRIVEAVTAGVAFLAAGTIVHAHGNVRGLTTGAGMWLSGGVGLACGAGYFVIALFATAFALLILHPLHRLERKLPKCDDVEPQEEETPDKR